MSTAREMAERIRRESGLSENGWHVLESAITSALEEKERELKDQAMCSKCYEIERDRAQAQLDEAVLLLEKTNTFRSPPHAAIARFLAKAKGQTFREGWQDFELDAKDHARVKGGQS